MRCLYIMKAMKDILIATHNAHKLEEFRSLLEPLEYRVVGADDIGLPDIEETGSSFQENSALKAVAAAKFAKMMAIADDSGLCVHALDDKPGIYSARYAAMNGGYPAVFDVLLNQLQDDFSAHFHCCLCLAFPDKKPVFFEGEVYGQLTSRVEMTGSSFGFDPIFRPDGYEHTFGGLPKEIKNKISHRANALAQLVVYLKNYNP